MPQAASGPYRGGIVDHLTTDWQPQNYSADAAAGLAWPVMNPRMRDLGRNEPSIVAATGALIDHVIGLGIGCSAAATLDSELDDEFNAEADALWDRWFESEIDSEGRRTGCELQQLSMRDAVDSGDSLWLEVFDPTPGRIVPLSYQLLEPEQIDDSVDRPRLDDGTPTNSGNRVVRGVELDSRNRPVAYYIWDSHPYDSWLPLGANTALSRRIPAERVLHWFVPGRPSQTRGVSLWAAAMQPARDRDWLVGNVLTAAAIQAIFTVIHQTDKGSTIAAGTDTGVNGETLFKLGRGMVHSGMPLDDKFTTISPTQPSAQLGDFIRLIMQLQSMASRMSYLRMTRDYSATNYSSARAAHEDDDKTFRPLQVNFGNRIVRPQHRAFLTQAAALGRLQSVTSRMFRDGMATWLVNELVLPGRRYIDPAKETEAAKARMAAGISTLKDEVGSFSGKSWRSNLRQLGIEKKFAEQQGVELDWGQKPPAPVTAQDLEEAA
jgi:lambda family phage portal protein